jgi:CheY-like chemotaxis protein
MTAEVQSKMFDPFFTTKEDGKGTGLGLSTVLGIVQQSHGFIISDSEAGRGTTFQLFFPASEPAEPRPLTGGEPEARRVAAGTVIVVDDNQAVLDFATRVLRSCGYHVMAAASGSEALERITHEVQHLDLVISDLMMPGMSGIDLADAVARHNSAIKVLFMSGHPAAIGSVGTEGTLLRKPFTNAELIAKVRDVLGEGPLAHAPSTL